MKVSLGADDARLYSKLRKSSDDIHFARYCASVLLKKGWHAHPAERRGTVYYQQAAFTTAMIVSYGRPFTSDAPRNGLKLPEKMIAPFAEDERALHDHLLHLRHSVYAHSDYTSFSIEPWRSGDFVTDIESAEPLRITAKEAALFQTMTSKLLALIGAEAKGLLG